MAPIVETYTLGPTQTNCYIVRADDGAEGVVVDPGNEGAQPSYAVAAILVTHCHWDHLGGIAELAETTGAPVYMQEREAPVLEILEPSTRVNRFGRTGRMSGSRETRHPRPPGSPSRPRYPGTPWGNVAYATDGAFPAMSLRGQRHNDLLVRHWARWSSRSARSSIDFRWKPSSIRATAHRRHSAPSEKPTPSSLTCGPTAPRRALRPEV